MSNIDGYIQRAYAILDGTELERGLIERLSELDGEDILDLVSLANKVRARFSPSTHACTIMNAQSGECSENCRFCAQSAHHDSVVDVYPLVEIAEILERARVTHESGVGSFGIVTSGYGFKKIDATFGRILEGIEAIHEEFPEMKVCASLGVLSRETATALADRDIAHYNINIQTNPSRYAELISTTHSVEERIETVRLLKKNGVGVCCGGIMGLGETMLDRIEMAYVLKDLDVDVIPLNVLIPIEGTAVEGQSSLPAVEVAKTFALFRLVNPATTIKFAAGRETRMNDFQGLLMLSGANGLLTGGYLTTRGRDTEQDKLFLKDLEGFSRRP